MKDEEDLVVGGVVGGWKGRGRGMFGLIKMVLVVAMGGTGAGVAGAKAAGTTGASGFSLSGLLISCWIDMV